jgi:hypothetical protein
VTVLSGLRILGGMVAFVVALGCTSMPRPVSWASRAYPTPGSAESRVAVAACEAKVDAATRRAADGHVTWEPSVDRFFGLPTVSYRPRYTWTPQEAAARVQMEQVVSTCMEEGGWIPCIWDRERSDASMDLRGPGWMCRRVRPDDPQP